MTTPFVFQLQDVRKLHRMRGRCLISWEMGLGKTLASLLYAQRHPELRPIVVVCPASIKYNWSIEAAKHVQMRATILEGTTVPDEGLFQTEPLLIVNYDITHAWLDYLKRMRPQLVIIDECGSYLGSQSTRRTKAVRELCKGVPHILALSGTPLVNRPAELFATLNILRPDLFPSFWSFAHQFCGATKTYWGWDFRGASNLKALHERLQSVMIRRRKCDVLADLPPKQRHVVPLEIDDRPQYQHALADFLDWLSQHDPVKVSSALRAQQLVRLGYLKRLAATLKMQAVCEWVDSFLHESDGKLVLFAIHKKIIKLLQTRYRNACVVVDGSISSKHRQLAVEQFQKQARTRIFLGQLKAAGVGLTLTAASTVAFAEVGWTPGEMVQAEDRCHRIGATGNVSIYYLVAHDTIEQYLLELIESKMAIINQVLEGNGHGDTLNVHSQLLKRMRNEPRRGLA